MSAAIDFVDVSKRFTLKRDRPQSFQELFVGMFRPHKNASQEFWALRDASFSVDPGQTVALIGANGAGKSTALKLISRIFQPTTGRVTVNGRVTALLELGAGFHPELSGRDNIYLNGAVMGLSRKELDRKADAIIDFAELHEFIDVQVKNYSSGMQARLGFAVSVHLDPQILLVDEALAVGDQAFQQKCHEHLQRMRRSGVTVLFVSHALDTVAQICSRGVWLEHGRVVMNDKAARVVDAYLTSVLKESREHQPETWAAGRYGSGEAVITQVDVLDDLGKPRRFFQTHEPVIIRLRYRARQPVHDVMFGLGFYHADTGAHLAGPNSGFSDYAIPLLEGEGWIDYAIPDLPWLAGDVALHTSIYDRSNTHQYDFWRDCARFSILPGGSRERYGLTALEGKWTLTAAAAKVDASVAAV